MCGACYAVCPTSALSQAFKPLDDMGFESGVKKKGWWVGQKINKDLLTKPDVNTDQEGG